MSNDRKTQIILGSLTLVGVLATAIFGNWDKLVQAQNPKSDKDQAKVSITQSATGNGNIQVGGSHNTVTVKPESTSKPKLNVDYYVGKYTGANIEISNQGQGTIVVSKLTLNWSYRKCPKLWPPTVGAPMVTYRYDVTLTAKDGAKLFEPRDFKYSPGEIDRFLIDLHYPKKGVYTTWLSFDYRVPGIDSINQYNSRKDSIEVCVGY